jgi:hypothetical protein
MGMGLLWLGRKRRHLVTGAMLIAAAGILALAVPASGWAVTFSNSQGELDCNGDSPAQQSLRISMNCTDIRGFTGVNNSNTWDGRFYDNGAYIGHDEPDMTFLSERAGSGNSVTWSETLPKDPAAAPTVSQPGSDVSHWFELSVAPWFSMAMCDPNSYPQTACTPKSDSNAPKCSPGVGAGCDHGGFPGGGGAFMEMQFYPPGFAPFRDAISCDNSHWCAALTIDSLECTLGFAKCNTQCEEPVNFAFIQTDGVPTGPASPQFSNLKSQTPNAQTLLMNPGDQLTVQMLDAPVPGQSGSSAFKVIVKDLTTGQSGYMQASAANGFQNTSIDNCSGKPFNFQPEYNTASKNNITPWAALQTDISTQFETGHWEPCTSVTDTSTIALTDSISDTFWNRCHGPYETSTTPDVANGSEPSDALCYPAGDTHGALNTAPDLITGCIDDVTQNGDLDFDGSPYWPEWPTGAAPTDKFPGSFVQSLPTTEGGQYSQFFIQTDLALSESTCSALTTEGCSVPPPNAPGAFYPYWTRVSSGGTCTLEFGNVSSGSGVNDFGKFAQYGADQSPKLGYPEFEGPVQSNACTT